MDRSAAAPWSNRRDVPPHGPRPPRAPRQHPAGRTLHVTEGVGLVVSRDGTTILLHAGDTVYPPPGEEHWHGATAGTCLSHLALTEVAPGGQPATWLEEVTDEQYQAAHEHAWRLSRRPGRTGPGRRRR